MNALWNSLPVPALLLNADDTIAESNPAAEAFLNLSAKALVGAPLWDKVMIDAPLEPAYARASQNRSSLFVNDVDVSSGERAPLQCNIQFAPLMDSGDQMLMIFEPREMAMRLTKSAQSGPGCQIGHRHGGNACPRNQEPARRDHRRSPAFVDDPVKRRP